MDSKLFVLTALLALLLAGCDTLNWAQYRVSGVSAHSSEEARLRAVLDRLSLEYGLVERTDTATISAAFYLHSQPDVQHFRVDLGARYFEGDALVDLMAGFGPRVQLFRKMNKPLQAALADEFGDRVVPSRVPIDR